MKTSKKERIELPKRLDYNEGLEELHTLSANHKELLNEAGEIGCYYCCNFFQSNAVTEWCDDGKTALCPNCGIDAVLPKKSDLTLDTLKAMYVYWFSVSAYSCKSKDGKIVDIIDVDGLYDPIEFADYRERQLANMQN